MVLRRAMLLCVLLALLVANFAPGVQVSASAPAQISIARQKAEALLRKMTPEERVGQLFLVSFQGTDVSASTQIYDLINRYHVGGVTLSADLDNFTGPDNTVTAANLLISSLQQASYNASLVEQTIPGTNSTMIPQYAPLLVAVSQDGGGYPYDQILNGVTPLPNLMALGATWDPDLTRRTGEVLGAELNAIGINLLLGPSLDVLDLRYAGVGDYLGARTFGGDPYWVGEMGKAYISGVHLGGQNRVAVVAKHFPGGGGSDRYLENEVATVRKSLEQLTQIELVPFFAVIGQDPSQQAVSDGLMVSHIRYQDFQGNIRDTTRPVSFDASAQEQLMKLPALASWRENDGLVVSDDLGSNAVKKFYSPGDEPFDARQIVRNAFSAGSDLLYANNLIATGDPDAYTTMVRTLQLFAQKYREDPLFTQRVDEAALRVLTLKFRLYPEFNINTVLAPVDNLNSLGKSEGLSLEIARKAVTLLSPSAAELSAELPGPPDTRSRIVFITDTEMIQQCSTCLAQPVLAVDTLANQVIRLYGSRAGGQVITSRISSYSYADLVALLNGAADSKPLLDDLNLADWLVFSSLNISNSRPSSVALRRFLNERPELFRAKKLIVFSFDAPSYLDSTDISKLSAYYALYSHTPAFLDVAARVLFQDLPPTGSLPVSVSGLGYDLLEITSPDPSQLIPLFIDLPENPEVNPTPAPGTPTPEATPIPAYRVGDTIPLRTGVIYDHNQNQVPDGTVVRFLVRTGGETGVTQQVETTTSSGVARTSYRLQTSGLLDIRVVSDPAMTSMIVTIDIIPGEEAAVTIIVPTENSTPTMLPSATATTVPSLTPTPEPEQPERLPGGEDWLFAMLIASAGAVGIFFASRILVSVTWAVRWALMALLSGMVVYTYIISGVAGSQDIYNQTGRLGLSGFILLGMLIAWAGGWVWRWRKPEESDAHFRRTNGPK
jgi:beta-N-acetylhexosaminidase